MGILRTGSLTTVRTAATYALAATWYECTAATLKDAGHGSNRMIIMVTAAVADPGDVEFYLQHSPDGGTTYYTHGSPQIIGPLTFGATGTKSIAVPFDIVPGDIYKVFVRASLNAASATLLVKALTYYSDAPAGDLQDAIAILTTIDADTSNIATYTTDLPNVIGTDGAAGPSKAISVAGTHSGGTLQEFAVDTLGQVRNAGGFLKVHGSDILVDFSVAVATSAILTAGKTYDLKTTEDCFACATTAAADDATSSDTPIYCGIPERITVPADEATNLYISAIKRNVGGVLHICEVDD